MSGRPPTIIRQGENDQSLEHFTDTDPNRIHHQQQQQQHRNSMSNPPPRPSTEEGARKLQNQIEGTDGNPLKGQPKREESGSGNGLGNSQQNPAILVHATEMPDVGAVVNMSAAPAMSKPRRGGAAGGGGLSGAHSGVFAPPVHEGSDSLSISQSKSGAFTNGLITDDMSNPGSPSFGSKSHALNARRQAHGQTNAQAKKVNKKENNMFASMMLGGTHNQDPSDGSLMSPRFSGGDNNNNDDAKSMARSRRQSMAVGDVIGALPQEDANTATMLVPATMEAPDQIFMPNMKREPYVPVRLARDKIKQALSEIASHNSKHYAAIDTMEKQYEILRAQMEHQVATYAKKLTFHYNQRIADLNKQLKERLTSGSKGQAFAQLMSDVETWKQRATDAEQELEVVKKELDKTKLEREEVIAKVRANASLVNASVTTQAPLKFFPESGALGDSTNLASGSLNNYNASGAPPPPRRRSIDDDV